MSNHGTIKRKQILTSSFFLKDIFAISLIILLFIFGLSHSHIRSLVKSSDLVIHTLNTNLQLEQLLSFVKDAETSQRGFIITRDTVFLQAYYDARKHVNTALIHLKNLTEDNPQQKENLDTLYHLINTRYTHVEASLKITADETIQQDLLNASLIAGKNIMENMRFHVNKMINVELQHLDDRQAKYESQILFTPLFSLCLLFFAFIIIIFSYIKITRDLSALEQKNESMRIMAEAMTQAEEIGDFSSWQWNVDTGVRCYSDNQYRLLGLPPQSFEPTFENFLVYVHDRDKHIIEEGEKKVMEGELYPSMFYRVIREDGELRYFNSLSKIITDAQGQKLVMGINADVTEQHLTMIDLEDRYKELEQSNKELASFNHVASHDLQEPLRKVQTYLSRFSKEDTSGLSEKGKEYFARIKLAVTRMRVLIDALLFFARANKTDKIFEKSDLNVLLENTKQDLAHLIEKSNAIITAGELPTLNVIPFQIQQLFTNLIGNSIKYSKPDVSPVINIDCQSVMEHEFLPSKSDSAVTFCKITIQDNGIGFDQEYAESIFTLFHRLHHNAAYEGTGIGLSICKKIAENHGGYISAEGIPGVGATFTVYFPSK